MEKYMQKTAVAAVSDHVFRILAAVGAGIIWFVWLWGLSLPALTAGIALGGLIWLCLRQLGKKRLQKREQDMRRMLGGEMAVDRLLMLPDRHAAFQAALWIAPKAPLEMQRTISNGVTGTLDGKPVMVWLIARHKSTEIDVGAVLEALRAAKEHDAQRIFLCVTAPMNKAAKKFVEEAEVAIRVVSREEMVFLAGICNPATDEDLLQLKKRRPRRKNCREWLNIIFDSSRKRRYLLYGLGLAGLWGLTRQPFYPIPAVICLCLYAGCWIYRKKKGEIPW